MNIRVKLEGRPVFEVDRAAYIKAKTRQLRDFGYRDITERHVGEQVDALLAGKKLTVIGKFMEDEIIKPKAGTP